MKRPMAAAEISGRKQGDDKDVISLAQPAKDDFGTPVLTKSAEEYLQIVDHSHFLKLEDRSKLTLGAAQFHEVNFMHAIVPRATLEWTRSGESTKYMTVLFDMQGSHTATSSGMLLERKPGVLVIPPGLEPVRFEADKAINEFIRISLKPEIYTDILPPYVQLEVDESPLNISELKPLFSFIISTCSSDKISIEIARNLEIAAQGIARSLLLSALGSQHNALSSSAYSRVKEFITRYYANQSIGVKDAADYADISIRKLQLELEHHGTTFTDLLQHVRTLAAVELREQKPYLKLPQIMQSCGFGSLSSLHRALKKYDERNLDDGISQF